MKAQGPADGVAQYYQEQLEIAGKMCQKKGTFLLPVDHPTCRKSMRQLPEKRFGLSNHVTLQTWFFSLQKLWLRKEWFPSHYCFCLGFSTGLPIWVYIVVYCLFHANTKSIHTDTQFVKGACNVWLYYFFACLCNAWPSNHPRICTLIGIQCREMSSA